MKKVKEAYNKLKSGADSQKTTTTEQTRPEKTEVKPSGTREIKMVNSIYYFEKNLF